MNEVLDYIESKMREQGSSEIVTDVWKIRKDTDMKLSDIRAQLFRLRKQKQISISPVGHRFRIRRIVCK